MRLTALGQAGLLALLFLFMTGLSAALLGGPFATFLGEDPRSQTLAAFASSTTGQVLCVIVLALFVHRRSRPLFAPEAFSKPTAVGWVAASVATGAFILAIYQSQVQGQPLAEPSLFNLAGSLLAGPVTGTAEEIVFRGAILARLAMGGWRMPMQIFFSGLLFGLPHVVLGFASGSFDPVTALSIVTATSVFGCVFAGVYFLSGRSLWPAIVGHALVNIVVQPWLTYSFVIGPGA